MGANIIITEVDEPKTLTDLDELKTPKVGGGYEYWVRKSDTKLTTKHISKNGTYNAKDDGAYGYNIVTVNVEPELTTKNVSKNGTYKAESDGADGFKIVSVNVPGGTGSSNNSGKPSGTDVTHTKPDGGLDLDGITPPGGPGSSVVGTDPETGNDVAVGVDKDGKIVKTPIPFSIHIIIPPTKTEYVEGETIIYDGMVVGLKKRDGTTFTDARYPNGHIPLGELVFPVKVAPEGGAGTDDWSALKSYVISNAGTYLGFVTSSDGFETRTFYKKNDGPAIAVFRDGNHGGYYSGPVLISTDQNAVETNYSGYNHTYNWGGLTWYINSNYHFYTTNYSNGGLNMYYSTEKSIESDFLGIMEQAKVRTSGGGAEEIPVQWKSPYDGRTMEDKFEITITGSSHTSESSSGTEDSGGGGTF